MTNLATILTTTARRQPEHVALRQDEQELTYAELEHRSALAAGWVQGQGCGRATRWC